MSAARAPRYRFVPSEALGWNTGSIDGLACLLRPVEAVLQSEGFSSVEVARALGGPLDLVRRSMGARFPGCWIEWIDDEPERNWERLVEAQHHGDPTIVMPDRFLWPHDEERGGSHLRDHALLIDHVDEAAVYALDTDGPPESGYLRTIAVEAALPALVRIGFVRDIERPAHETAEEYYERVRLFSIETLTADVPAMASVFGPLCDGERELDEMSARAVQSFFLSNVQQGLFLFAAGIGDTDDPRLIDVAQAAYRAATSAHAMATRLIAALRLRKTELYLPIVRRHERCLRAIEDLRDLLERDVSPVRTPRDVSTARAELVAHLYHLIDRLLPPGAAAARLDLSLKLRDAPQV